MSKILEMRQKRADLWDKAKAFLDEHEGENGLMSAEDTEEYERMEQEVADMGHAIERMERAAQLDKEMNEATVPVLAGQPERPAPAADNKRGTASDAYKKAFWNSIRGRVNYDVRNALQVGELTEGGYTVPDEFEHQLIEALQEENIMRGLVHVISTASGDRKIPLVTNYGNASWIDP